MRHRKTVPQWLLARSGGWCCSQDGALGRPREQSSHGLHAAPKDGASVALGSKRRLVLQPRRCIWTTARAKLARPPCGTARRCLSGSWLEAAVGAAAKTVHLDDRASKARTASMRHRKTVPQWLLAR